MLSPDQVSTTYRIGDATVTRVQELTLDVASPSMLYPEWRRELLDGREDSLFPDSWDMSRTSLLQSIHTWVVQTPQHTILIDTATGNDKERPFVPALHHLHTPYLDRLKSTGVMPGQVDFVFITHLHVDHVGWNTQWVNSQSVPTFPKARYFMPKREQEYYASPEGRKDPRYVVYEDSISPIVQSRQAELVEADRTEVVEGFRFLSTPGHSLDHMSIVLESRGEIALFGGDVMHHPSQVYFPQLNSIYCGSADLARSSRRFVLDYGAERQATYFSTHFPASSAGRITRSGEAFEWRYL